MSPVIRTVGVASLLLAPLGGCRIDAPNATDYLGGSTGGTSPGSTSLGGDGDSTTSTTAGAVDTVSGSGDESVDSGTQTGDTGPGPESCGNGMIEAGEDCDAAGESATCDDDCTLVDCGDGVTNTAAGESCDAAGESAACDVDCTARVCGDGVFNQTAGEECDDAGRSAACDDDCTLVGCGDGVTNTAAGEGCDDTGESPTCNSDCSISACGDGVTNTTAGEACDHMGESLTCDDDCTLVECGDLELNTVAGEICDGLELDGATCEGEGFDGGMLACAAGCQLDTTGCTTCGDGMAGSGETCDGGDLGEGTCVTQGFDGGVLGCSPACTYDTSACFGCGDGSTDPGEQCDDGGESPGCDIDCTFASCGDDLPNASAGEQCDEAGETATCDVDCTVPACGDALVNTAAGEQCDGSLLDGSSCVSQGFDSGMLGCDGDCMGLDTSGCGTCGNGVIDGSEDCDDSNELDGDACPGSCLFNRYIFVSSAMYTGNFGGLAGADAECQALADAAGLPGMYMAWLSTNGESPSTRMTQSTVPYVRPDGAQIAPNWAGLIDGNLAVPINVTETGGPVPIGNTGCAGGGFPTVWSATFANGTSPGVGTNCSDWTSVMGGGQWGRADSTDSSWSAWCSGGICSWVSPIYCVQQ